MDSRASSSQADRHVNGSTTPPFKRHSGFSDWTVVWPAKKAFTRFLNKKDKLDLHGYLRFTHHL